jgi:GT2 family glycosyltransferase
VALKNAPVTPEILLYDNSPFPAHIEGHNITYVHDPSNKGVSHAYNNAAIHARKRNKSWLLLLDQDTRVEPSLFDHMVTARQAFPLSVAFAPLVRDSDGLLSPYRFSGGRGRRIISPERVLKLKTHRFINSGLFINCSAFARVGGYDERIPLDFSDISFGNRLEKITDHFVVLDVSLHHSFSNAEHTAIDDALTRFHHFCTGAMVLGRTSGSSYLSYFNILLRASRLTLRHRDHRFLSHFFQRALHG